MKTEVMLEVGCEGACRCTQTSCRLKQGLQFPLGCTWVVNFVYYCGQLTLQCTNYTGFPGDGLQADVK